MDASVNRIPSSRDERALLIGLKLSPDDPIKVEYSMNELKLLVKTSGGLIIDSFIIKRESIDPGTIVGSGHLEKIKIDIQEKNIKLLVFDLNSLKPSQVRNLEENIKCRVVGRTEIILEIFARRAKSSEAMIQVELAQLRYILPRLKGLGGALSRLGGGIGTRGPGEKMLETDKRHIQKRITVLKKKFEKIKSHRAVARKSRSSSLTGAVVGYTNAGKSTLVNLLAKDDLFVEDRLFATLDSFTRSVFLDSGKTVLLTDTVGFIRNLPANLVESFRSTLEEIVHADFLIHVVDINASDIEMNINTVREELIDIDAAGKPEILFFNKSDTSDEDKIRLIKMNYPESIIGSAKDFSGIDLLKSEMIKLYDKQGQV
jgi:GTP-binding protein HflX